MLDAGGSAEPARERDAVRGLRELTRAERAVRLPLPNSDRLLLALTGFVGVLFGIVMFVNPGDGALVLLSLIAAYSLIVGVIELVAAIGGKRLLQKAAQDYLTPAGPQAQH